ncbi:potassium channel family protein [Leptolinea tardivitalis]|uniref:Trk system potassium uptake protein TrkA n=1 Tax=Leptolinea tardivitalis TaxID=229920 RepID=A0A0P6WYP4_9CHLR|nr:TrkA family potassium uptake protein [Leptolinea tardivitalis]KPL71693.1 portal protein [Leptolinea tardivitalis]GAP20038.1 K+ transport system, NAD-binding component [Leptolinea tardivitalis]
MKVIVIGCGRLGAELAYNLYKRGHEVSVIDNVPASFNNLPADFQGRLNEGEALSQDVLHRAGIEKADAVAAVTNSDSLNAVAAYIARSVYKVPNVLARNYDPRTRELFEYFGLQTVSSTSWGAQRMEELIFHSDIRTVFSAGNGEVELYEVVINDIWDGKTLNELIDCDDCLPVSLTRAGRAVIPSRDTKVRSGDVALFSATFEGIENLRRRLKNVDKQEA